MSEALPKSSQQTLWDTASATSSPAEASGRSPSDGQDGTTAASAGREAAPAPASAQQAKAKGLATLVTSGLIGYGSSASAALQQCLENRLMQRLDTAGSTLFSLTWKRKATPLGRRYLERAASGRRTAGKGFTSVPSPKASDENGSRYVDPQRGSAVHYARPGHSSDLCHVAQHLASVPTPMAGSPATETYNAAGNSDYSRRIVELATVPTPRVCENVQTNLDEIAATGSSWLGQGRGATVAAVTTPSARDWKDTSGMSESGVDPDGSTRSRLDQLPRQAQLAASGPTATGGTEGMASTGQLDPAYSRWLQGIPPMWCWFTVMAHRSRSVRRKRG